MRQIKTLLSLSLFAQISLSLFAVEGSDTPEAVIARIRDEGLNRSQVMDTLAYLTEVIGPRLTASPSHKRANLWTKERLACWGLTNAHLEPWGPYGRGWTLKRFSMQLAEPQAIPLVGCPSAWSPGLPRPISARVVLVDAKSNADLEKYKGQLTNAIVMISPVREISPPFSPLAVRLVETNLLALANASPPAARRRTRDQPPSPPRVTGTSTSPAPSVSASNTSSQASVPASSTNASSGSAGPSPRGGRGNMGFQGQLLAFLKSEGAALVIRSSPMGDGGIVLAQSAALPSAAGSAAPGALRPWATNAPPTLPQVTMGVDDYNRVARMIQQGEKPVMAVEFESRFEDADLMAYNTIAEIPGSDRKKEVVMLGAHLDSWHAGTGATDNGIGVAVVMEAVRLLKAAGAAPRRTIRVGLWAGEEQGLLGSKAYVADHLGYFTNETTAAVVSPKEAAKEDSSSAKRNANSESDRKLIRKPAHAKISAYFNYDNGAGKIRGIYLQGNEMAQSVFRRWFEPIKDLGVETITLSNTYGTDHLSFDAIGIPGFQFIQDPLDYGSRTHHTNADTYDRVPPEDARQASVVMAVTAYQAAMAEDKVPRKPLP